MTRASALTVRAAMLAASAACAAFGPALAQDLPGGSVTIQGPPEGDKPSGRLRTFDPERDQYYSEIANAPDVNAAVTFDRIAIQPELPEGTPADVADRAVSGNPITSLTEALLQAYWTSPTLLAQRATVRSFNYRIAQARAEFGPKLSYSFATSYQNDRFDQRTGPPLNPSGWTTTASAILTQPLFTFGRNALQERSSRAQLEFQLQVLRSAEQQTILDAITAYIGVLRDRTAVTIAKDNLAALQRQADDNQARLAVREVTATDVQQISTRVALGEAQVYSAQRDAASSEAAFLRVVGVPAGALEWPDPLQSPVHLLEEAYAYAELNSPVVLAAQAREKVSRATVAASKADLLPRIDFQGTASYGSQSLYSDDLRQRELRGQFIISGPIFESGLRRARVNEALAANDADWLLVDAALRENRATLASAWNDWRAQQAAITSYRSAEDSARKAYEGAMLQQRAGFITTLDVLDLARELLVARSNSNTANANAFIAKARLLAAMGALEQTWLLPDVAHYSANQHLLRISQDGDVPLITPVLRAIENATAIGSTRTRPVRDPAGPRTTPSADITVVDDPSVHASREADPQPTTISQPP